MKSHQAIANFQLVTYNFQLRKLFYNKLSFYRKHFIFCKFVRFEIITT